MLHMTPLIGQWWTFTAPPLPTELPLEYISVLETQVGMGPRVSGLEGASGYI